MFYINFTGSSGEGFVGYDNSACVSLDMAMTFGSREEAEKKASELQKEWQSNLSVCELAIDN